MKVLIQEIMSEYNVPIHKIRGINHINPITDNFISIFFPEVISKTGKKIKSYKLYHYFFDKECMEMIKGSEESLVKDLRKSIHRTDFIYSSKKKRPWLGLF